MKMQLQRISLRHQQGVVLFIALIVLVALSLTGIALVRSVDTANLAAGNLSFKKSALLSSDPGIDTALNFLAGQATFNAANPASGLNTDSVGAGYYSTYSTPSFPVAGTIATDIQGRPTNWPGATAGAVQMALDAATGNTVTYIIQRMCNSNLTSGDAADRSSRCLTDPAPVCHSPPCIFSPPPIYYRITTMVQGPHNALSYVQTMVRKP